MASPAVRGTRERILEVAEASLGERGYHGTRLHQIADQVGIQKASLFHYFASKEDIYRAVIDAGFGETEQTVRRALEIEGAPEEKIQALVDAYIDIVAAHPERTKILLRQSLGDSPVADDKRPDLRRLLDLIVSFVADGQRTRVFAPVDPLALVLSIIGMVAFFFTSAPVIAPEWFDGVTREACVERIKRHTAIVVRRCLTGGGLPRGIAVSG
ncbi:MAG TPA: TetR/AcrR family transcriptional regulator [Candidatus Dormibacteraeota bacterium]|nr:TetR/AcrR family transcriptional regulator [Candidatus Dormibacteraeota bacterium]